MFEKNIFYHNSFSFKLEISVSGHSRGGEASVSTYIRNLLRPPGQHFSIVSVSSIAPTDFDSHTLGNVPYFVIIPAADGDVADLVESSIGMTRHYGHIL
jgi:hypothetical protein